MVFFSNSAEARRLNRIDAELDMTNRLLHEPAIIAALGGRAAHLAYVNGLAYVPTIRHGEIQMPRTYDERGIAIVSSLPDEKLFIPTDLLKLHPVQLGIYRQRYEGAIPPDEVNRLMVHINHQITLRGTYETTIPKRAGAITWHMTLKSDEIVDDDEPNYSLLSRPLIILNDAYTINRPLTHIHEYSHVLDFLTGPIVERMNNDMYADIHRTELKAYNTEALVMQTIRNNPEMRTLRGADIRIGRNIADRIDGLRKDFNTDSHDEFFPAPQLIDDIRDQVGEIKSE